MISLEYTKNRSARIIPISTTLHMILTEYLLVRNGNPNEPLFCNIYGEPMGRITLQCSISKYCKNHDVEKKHQFTYLGIHLLQCVTAFVLLYKIKTCQT